MSGGGVTPSPTPAEPNLFYRVCPVSGIATPVIVDDNGEVCYIDHDGDFSIIKVDLSNMTLSEDSTDAVMTACEAFTGGSVEVEATTDGSGNTILKNGDYHIAIDQSGNIVEGEVTLFDSVDPIGVDGVVQVFKDQACTKYADGQSNVVYVRVNENFGDGDYRDWGEESDPDSLKLVIYTPTEIDPQDQYMIAVWVDLRSDVQPTPFAEGDIVRCEQELYFQPVSNCKVLFV